MAFTPAGQPRLQLDQALRDGWAAFCRAPWPFVLFTLISGALSLAFQALANLASLPEASQPPAVLVVLATLVGSLGHLLVSLWGTVGLIRGAWSALEGGRPNLGSFLPWDGSAAGRLLLRQLLFALLVFAIVLPAALLAVGFSQLQPWLAALPLLLALLLLFYLAVGQTFLPWVALLGGEGPMASLQRGRQVVDRQWWMVLLLVIVQSAIVLAGALLCGVGLLAAAPLSLCVATAAYRQLFGSEDRTGLLGNGLNG
ncbi:MAG: hypothetical protein ACK4V5_15075 [Cyanobium sp.]|jgi:hypothetical protein